MAENYTVISQGYRTLLTVLAPYIARELELEFGKEWWQKGVMDILYDDSKRNLPLSGDWGTLVDSLDTKLCLLLFDLHWQRVFRKKLSIDYRTWAKELSIIRDKHAHIGSPDFSDDNTWRALDTMSRFCEQIDSESAEEIRGMLRVSRYGSESGSTAFKSGSAAPTAKTKTIGILDKPPISGLPCWRDVIAPHPDVAQGRYKNAEFAADLAQVARGEGAFEYRDPVEFFNRTYVTEGMTGLLEQALRRICGKDGDPVIQLKTAFGGGKTHSMLALYHMMRGNVSVDKLTSLKPVLERAGVSTLPKANVAVLVGTALDPTKSKRPNNMPGVTINTFWGEMAAQLAEASGNHKAYDYVRESDKKGVSPGSETLKNLLDACGPCLILIDELVAYAKNIYGKTNLPSGTFDTFVTFIQVLTEAARASKNSLVVASIPESEIEIGGEAGRTVLDTIEHTFGRMESIWKPVAANEGFEVVRRRLFLDCKNPEGRDAVCAAFSRLYSENQNDFPIEAKELAYKERLVSCYPIHPEVFDRLYSDWSTLDRFQRTRGVLRLMAAVVYELWMGNDAGLMIMPGSIPLDAPKARDELTRYLSENWNGIVDKEVDGKDSAPYGIDKAQTRYGSRLAARRVSRTIMLGSAPTSREQAARGIESSRIRLGVAQPGENISIFNDALNTLRNALAYLYSNSSGDRYWYDDRPTLRKTAEERATQVSASEVEHEIEERLRSLKKEQPFAGIHICPGSSLDVPDEQSVRLVILRPADGYKASNPNCGAMTAVTDFLNNRGNNPRIFRNMLVFAAPDQELMNPLNEEVKRYIAWKTIKEDSISLNLDAAQNKETNASLETSDRTVNGCIKETYCWLFMPYIDKNADLKSVIWDINRISGGNDSIIAKAAAKTLQSEAVINEWGPMLLRMELDNLLWRGSDNIQVKKLWEFLCTYCYLPRIANENVLENAIRAGLNSKEYFAFASGYDGTRYIDLKFNRSVASIERSGYLVKPSAAQKQLDEEEEAARISPEVITAVPDSGDINPTPKVIDDGGGATPDSGGTEDIDESKNTHFYMSAVLDNTRINRDFQKILEEVINNLAAVDGAQVEVSLELNVKAPNGMSQKVVRDVYENCRTLKVKSFGFD